MKTEVLEKLGITVVQVRDPRILDVPGIGHVVVRRGETIADVFEAVWDVAFTRGKDQGKNDKIDELKKILNL